MYNFGFLKQGSVMQHNIRDAGTLTYVLEIDATAEDLTLDVRQAVRKRRSASNLKGFRPGRVPHQWIRRLYKRELEEEVAKTIIDEAYEDLVTQSGQYDVVGSPRRLGYSYELDGALHVELEFVTKPVFELKDIEKEVLEVKNVKPTDEIVDAIAERLGKINEGMRPLADDERIGDEDGGMQDAVLCEATEVDPATGVVLVGVSKVEMEVQLNEPAYADNPEYQALCAALIGRRAGDQVLVKFTEEPADGVVETNPVDRAYNATIKEAKRRYIPELTDELVQFMSCGFVEFVDEWPGAIRRMTELVTEIWNAKSKDDAIIARTIELQDVPVPEGLVRRNLDEYRESVGQGKSDESTRADYFRQILAWHYVHEKMHKTELFKWPVEHKLDGTVAEQELETIRVLESVFGSESLYSERPTPQRCALDYLAEQFDIKESDDDSSDDIVSTFAMAIFRCWSNMSLEASRPKGN